LGGIAPAVDCDIESTAGERSGDAEPNPAAAAGNQRNFFVACHCLEFPNKNIDSVMINCQERKCLRPALSGIIIRQQL
jgi:hypothetical protein